MGGSDISPANTEQTEILSRLTAQPKALRANAEQACAGTDEGKLQVEEAKSRAGQCSTECEQPGDRPLIVLTAGKFWAPAGLEKPTEFHDVWVHQLHASLVHLSTHGRQTIVDADHGMSEAPDAVVIAIQQVVKHGCHHSMFWPLPTFAP